MGKGPGMNATTTRVIDLLKPLVRIGVPASVTPHAQLYRDLMLDSLDRQSLAVELDVAFSIEIPDAALTRWCTVQDVADTVTQLLPLTPALEGC